MKKVIEHTKPPFAETTKPPLAEQIAALEAEIIKLTQEHKTLSRDYLIGMALCRLGKFSGLQAATERLAAAETLLKDRSAALEGLKIIVGDPVLLYQHAREVIGIARATELLTASTQQAA